MVEMTGLDNASLVSFLLQVLLKIQRAKNRYYKNIFKKTNNNNPKQGGSETKPL